MRDAPVISRFALLCNLLPLVLLAVIGASAWVAAEGGGGRAALFAVQLYLFPALVARTVLALFGRPVGRGLQQDSRAFRVWWVLMQLQMPFNRLPWLEEMLRLVPGLYPAWLRLWGGDVHPLSFWAPGAKVIDRPLIEVGAGAVIGAEAMIASHLARIDNGRFLTDVATVRIGAGAVVGGRASIGPGCVVEAGETVTAGLHLAPFKTFVGGRRI